MITIVAIVAMILVAAGVVISVKGLPKVDLGDTRINLDAGYDERKAKRQDAQATVVGEWISPDNDDFVIDVWRDGEGFFHATVNYSEQENDVTFWEMSGSWQDSTNGFNYNDCKKTHVTYDDSGNATEEVIYEDGTGSIYGSGEETLTWEDKEEKMGAGIAFEYSGEY